MITLHSIINIFDKIYAGMYWLLFYNVVAASHLSLLRYGFISPNPDISMQCRLRWEVAVTASHKSLLRCGFISPNPDISMQCRLRWGDAEAASH